VGPLASWKSGTWTRRSTGLPGRRASKRVLWVDHRETKYRSPASAQRHPDRRPAKSARLLRRRNDFQGGISTSAGDLTHAVVPPRASYRNCSVNKSAPLCVVSDEVMRPVVSRLWVWVKGVGDSDAGGMNGSHGAQPNRLYEHTLTPLTPGNRLAFAPGARV
jgi:hypothetical protein